MVLVFIVFFNFAEKYIFLKCHCAPMKFDLLGERMLHTSGYFVLKIIARVASVVDINHFSIFCLRNIELFTVGKFQLFLNQALLSLLKDSCDFFLKKTVHLWISPSMYRCAVSYETSYISIFLTYDKSTERTLQVVGRLLHS